MPAWIRNLWYDCIWVNVYAGMLLFWSLKIQGSRNIPRRGPVLLIANHQSYLDSCVVGMSCRRQLSYLARKTLFDNPFFRWLIYSLNAVPVDQEGVGKEGIKAILAQLKAGRAVIVHPEGERTPDGRMQGLKPGIVLLIKRVQAPIVPLGIAGAYDAWPRGHWPRFAPLWFPPRRGTIASWVGKPLDGRHFAHLPREKILDELFTELQKAERQAERLRRK
jgi:1-acyl-sn-glycerol-3-phosphate acyltransferase